MGIFEWIHTYLGIKKLFQALGSHMATTGKYWYKTSTFITKKIVFSNLFVTLNIVYTYVYDVPQ